MKFRKINDLSKTTISIAYIALAALILFISGFVIYALTNDTNEPMKPMFLVASILLSVILLSLLIIYFVYYIFLTMQTSKIIENKTLFLILLIGLVLPFINIVSIYVVKKYTYEKIEEENLIIIEKRRKENS